jgi:hypothetical protein
MMKTLVISLVSGLMLSQVPNSAGSSSANVEVRDLAVVRSFAFGGVGVAGIISEGERNLRLVLQQPDASERLQAAVTYATPAGKLYIMVGLRRCDRAAYHRTYDLLTRFKDDVEVVRGCMVSKEPFHQILSEIEAGRFDDYLSRPIK